MLTKILDNNLDRNDFNKNVNACLLGTWGNVSNTDNDTEDIYLGRASISFIYSGTVLINPSKNHPALAQVIYTDNTSEMIYIDKYTSSSGTFNCNKEIKLAVITAQLL